MRINYIACFFVLILVFSCSSSKKLSGGDSRNIGALKFINAYEVPHGLRMEGTEIGGLSGIDYYAADDIYYMICDDPSARGAARFYTAKIPLSGKGIDTVIFTGVTTIKNPEGKPYADITKDLPQSADLESMRYNPVHGFFVRGSEGQRRIRPVQQLQNADIVIMDRNGNWMDSFALPPNMLMQPVEKGPRHNSVFEGLDFSENFQRLYVSVEEPLHEDGPKAGTGDSTSWVRIMEFDIPTRKQLAQFAYETDPVPHPANPPGAFKINGISDIMQVGEKKFIVIERAYSVGRVESDIRLFLADANEAENIAGNISLEQYPSSKPMKKKLLLDMNKELEVEVFNVEGITWGPRLPNGNRSLVLVTDNNFNPRERTQFFLFEVIP